MSEAIEIVLRIITIILSCIGCFFFIIGTLGLLRFPDFYCRAHAATKCDTLGAGSILLAIVIYERFSFDALKILVLCGLVLLSSPTVGHALSRAAFRRGLAPWVKAPTIAAEKEKEE